MSYCDGCLHREVCGSEGVGDEALIFCEDRLGWIPVAERLPNLDEYIKNNGLFNVSDGDRSYSEWFDFHGKQKFGEATTYGFRVDRAVTAWMSLPESYKAESEPQESEE